MGSGIDAYNNLLAKENAYKNSLSSTILTGTQYAAPKEINVWGSLLGTVATAALTGGIAKSQAHTQAAQAENAAFAKATSGSITAMSSFKIAKESYNTELKTLENLKTRKESATTADGKTETTRETELKEEKANLEKIGAKENNSDNAQKIEAFHEAQAKFNKLSALKPQIQKLDSDIAGYERTMMANETKPVTVNGGIKLEGGSAVSTLNANANRGNYNIKKNDGTTEFNQVLFDSDMETAKQLDEMHTKYVEAENNKKSAEASKKKLIDSANLGEGETLDSAIANAKAEMDRLGNESISGDDEVPSAKLYDKKMKAINDELEQITKDKENGKDLDAKIEAQTKVVESKKNALDSAKKKLTDAKEELETIRASMQKLKLMDEKNQKGEATLKKLKNTDDDGNSRGWWKKLWGTSKNSQYKATKKVMKNHEKNYNQTQNEFLGTRGYSYNPTRLAEIEARIKQIDQLLVETG